MKISQAFRKAFRTVSGQKTEALKLLVTEIALTGICLAPLLFLTEKGPLRYLAALAGVLFSLRLADPGNYGKKIGYAFGRLGLLILWSLPMIAALLYAWEMYAGQSANGLTVLDMIYQFGGQDMKTGILYLLLILLGLILIAALGAGFHSGDRHAFVLDEKKLLKGERANVLLCRICSLVFLLPVIIAAGIVISRYIPLLNDVSGVVAGDVPRPSDRETLIILGIGAALTLPLLPLRSMVTAAYVNGLRE